MSKTGYDPFADLLADRSRRASRPAPEKPAGQIASPSLPSAQRQADHHAPAPAPRQKKTVNFRLDPELLAAARAEAAANRMTLTALVTQSIVYRLANPSSFGSSSAPTEL